jgi:hypothetical protein
MECVAIFLVFAGCALRSISSTIVAARVPGQSTMRRDIFLRGVWVMLGCDSI